jgi:hypothetical protein
MMEPAPEVNAGWRKQITNFLIYIRERGHRRHWLIFGQQAIPIGMVVPPVCHHNDNGPSA